MQSTVSAAVVLINAQYLKTCQTIPKVTEPSGRQVVIDKMNDLMADYFFSDGPAIGAVIIALADAFYEAAIDQKSAV
ncbi:hypothetical protein O5Y_00230 [Rhodococcus erythropolis CCM2595]|nr:hypothetical protein O5Y_00230 [Rhodococcus erythropolis CCM2595]